MELVASGTQYRFLVSMKKHGLNLISDSWAVVDGMLNLFFLDSKSIIDSILGLGDKFP